jgi:general secretion pathway protein L
MPAVLGVGAISGRDPACPRRRRWLIARLDGSQLQLTRIGPAGAEPLAHFDTAEVAEARTWIRRLTANGLGRLPVVLRLPPAAGLFFRDLLPPCRQRELAGLLAHRIGLRTPFAPETVVFRAWTMERHPDGRREVAVVVCPRRPIEEGRSRLAALGLHPRVVDFVVDDPLAPPLFDLSQELSAADRRERWLRRGAIAATLLALAATALAIGLGLQERQIAARLSAGLERLPVAPAPDPAAIAALEALRADLDRLEAETTTRPSPLVLLEITSRLLPDDAWLESLTLSGRELVLSGYAADAGRLLRLFEETPFFEATRFEAPSTRVAMPGGPAGGRVVERFTLATRITGLGSFAP